MILSRGIGNSIIPLIINNRPEIVVIELSVEREESSVDFTRTYCMIRR